MQLTLNSRSKEDTMAIASKLAPYLEKNDVVYLEGELGAGKTTFTQGIAKGLGIVENVKSPTFTIVKTYFSGRIPLFHIDAYRLEGHPQDIGLDEYLESEGVTLIEWPSYLNLTLNKPPIILHFTTTKAKERKIEISCHESWVFSFEKEVEAWR